MVSPVIIAGLTGGIASGKSTVSSILAQAGATIIDADKIARQVVEPGTPGYHDIIASFGRGILFPDGTIDRKRLGDIIFNDANQKARLNAIVHPLVHQETERTIEQIAAKTPDAVVVLDIPLLLETGMRQTLTEVIVVYVPEHIQLHRLMVRDQIDEQAALARIRSQMPIEEKRRLATVVIDNSGSFEDTRAQAMNVFSRLTRQSKSMPAANPL